MDSRFDPRWFGLNVGRRNNAEAQIVESYWNQDGADGLSLTEEERRNMEIKRSGSQPSTKGPADWFSGTVRIDPLFAAPDPSRVVGASVTFEPGARTAWHTHPLG